MKRNDSNPGARDGTLLPALVDLSSLLAAPLIGLAEADFATARAAARLIEDQAFVADEEGPGDDGHLGTLRTVSFVRPETPGAERSLVRIPALSLVPLPLLQIAEAELRMDVRLVRPSSGEDSSASGQPRWDAMLAPRTRSGRRGRGSLSGSNIALKVRVRQADLPAGVATLLQVAGHSASSVPIPVSKEGADREPEPK
ncbi:MAG TPA: DUF2589 domain-containing protein [Thermoanaerobaculia bacterium]|nr:DUF2589 domain-containing protein [Thermoanaerobaculia bacterium]